MCIPLLERKDQPQTPQQKVAHMTKAEETMSRLDNGGRRIGVDRRQFAYAGHIPERRRGFDRRSGTDRRALPTPIANKTEERRAIFRQ